MADLKAKMAEIVKEISLQVTIIKQSFRGLTGSWTKYGGKRTKVSYNQYGIAKVSGEWVCQSCGHKQHPADSPYLYEYPQGEYIRACAMCLNNGCQRLKDRLFLVELEI